MPKQILRYLTKPLSLGIYLVALFGFISLTYYDRKDHGQNDDRLVRFFDTIGYQLHNLKLRYRGPQVPETPIAILAVDEESLEKIGHWPWPRSVFAKIAETLNAYQARNLAFDIIFAEEDQKSAMISLQRVRHLGQITPTTHPELDQIINQEMARENTDEIFARSIAKFSSRLIMGSYFEEFTSDRQPHRDLCFDTLYESTPDYQYWTFQNIPVQVSGDSSLKMPKAWDSVLRDQVFPILQQEELNTWRTRSPNYERRFQQAMSFFSGFGLDDENMVQFLIQYWVDRKDQEFADILDLVMEDGASDVFHRLQSELPRIFSRADQVNLRSAFMDRKIKYCLNSFWSDADPAQPGFEESLDSVYESHPELQGYTVPQIQSHLNAQLLINPITRPGRWWTNIIALARGTSYTGFFNTKLDSDGVIRKARLLVHSGDHYIPSISFLSYLTGNNFNARINFIEEQGTSSRNKFNHVSHIEILNASGELVQNVPVDKFGDLIINYAGPDRSFPYLSVAELLSPETKAKISQLVWDAETDSWRVQESFVDKLSFIKDRHFIIGATAVGLYDLRVTPFTENYPGVETHANVLSNLTTGEFLKAHPKEKTYMLVFVVVAGILLGAFISYSSAIYGFLATGITLTCVVAFDYLYVFSQGYVVATFLPLISLSSVYFALTSFKYFTEERQKKELKGTFQKYVSPAIVNEVLRDPNNLSLGGRKQLMSVFFSDVRGFTTISEKLDPQELSSLLNNYLTPMTEIVFKNKGTLDKYMGDAIMAFFGAPIPYSDHAEYACRCALEQIQKLKEIQEDYASKGLPMIDIGIGINTGEMSVGNMGSKTIRSYTVMGDAVNLGSRLEGINKEYGTKIIISEFTKASLGETFWTREIDQVRVKGKVKPVRIFELISESAPPQEVQDMLETFQTGYALYMKSRFQEARQSFQKGLDLLPTDPVCKLYVQRCDDYIAEPPPENWDGVFVMKTK